MKDYQVLNAWLSVLKKSCSNMKQKPEIFLEYHCGVPIDLIVNYFECNYVWICELKSKNIDRDKNKNQVDRLLNMFSKKKLINCGILNPESPQKFMILFIIGNSMVLDKIDNTINEICPTKKNKYEIIGIERDRRSIQVVVMNGMNTSGIFNKIKTIKARYIPFFSVLLDETTIRGGKPRIKLLLINSLLEVISSHSNSEKFGWDDISNTLKRDWIFFELSMQVDREMKNLFKKIVKPFADKKLLEYNKNDKNWTLLDKKKLFDKINNKSALIKKIVASDNRQLPLLNETN